VVVRLLLAVQKVDKRQRMKTQKDKSNQD